jgi:hypothetical protein
LGSGLVASRISPPALSLVARVSRESHDASDHPHGSRDSRELARVRIVLFMVLFVGVGVFAFRFGFSFGVR